MCPPPPRPSSARTSFSSSPRRRKCWPSSAPFRRRRVGVGDGVGVGVARLASPGLRVPVSCPCRARVVLGRSLPLAPAVVGSSRDVALALSRGGYRRARGRKASADLLEAFREERDIDLGGRVALDSCRDIVMGAIPGGQAHPRGVRPALSHGSSAGVFGARCPDTSENAAGRGGGCTVSLFPTGCRERGGVETRRHVCLEFRVRIVSVSASWTLPSLACGAHGFDSWCVPLSALCRR